MTLSRTMLRRMDVLSALVLVLAAGIYISPVSITAPETTALTQASMTMPAPAAADTLDARYVISTNILSASRRAPARRYVSPDLAGATEFSMPTAFAPSVDSTNINLATGEGEDAVPALYGTVQTDGVWRALLRLSGNDANPSLFREGDKRGAYRVVRIRSNAVVVAGPSGQRTLRLAHPARGDSIGKSP